MLPCWDTFVPAPPAEALALCATLLPVLLRPRGEVRMHKPDSVPSIPEVGQVKAEDSAHIWSHSEGFPLAPSGPSSMPVTLGIKQ